jgi:hypothetical protein
MPPARSRRRVVAVIAAALALVIVVLVAVVAVPILTHQNQGLSHQEEAAEQWPLTVTAVGDDGRERTLSVVASDGELDTSHIATGQRFTVTGTGYDAERGIYVAICQIPAEGEKPSPCIGGVPEQEQEQVAEGTVQYAASNWINDDWAWKLFGARSYDDPEAGTFTAYLEVGDAASDAVDCVRNACAIFTRNDHTAASDRVQDLHLPVRFADQ